MKLKSNHDLHSKHVEEKIETEFVEKKEICEQSPVLSFPENKVQVNVQRKRRCETHSSR